MKKRIALDMDEVIADVAPKFLHLYEKHHGVKLVKEDYWGKKIYHIHGAERIRDFVFEKGFFADLPVMEGSQEVVKALHEHYDIFITTAAMEFRNSFEDKYDWLKQHFPFIHWKNIVFMGDKSILNADYMIDDNIFNLKTFSGKGLLYTAYHNVNETGYTRLNNWQEVWSFFQNELNNEKA